MVINGKNHYTYIQSYLMPAEIIKHLVNSKLYAISSKRLQTSITYAANRCHVCWPNNQRLVRVLSDSRGSGSCVEPLPKHPTTDFSDCSQNSQTFMTCNWQKQMYNTTVYTQVHNWSGTHSGFSVFIIASVR